VGKITDVVRQHAPASYRALCSLTNEYYSLEILQDLAEFVQFRLYATIADQEDEATVYNPKERELLGILTTLQFIPAAVDYWGDQLASQQASGVNESQAYFDRRTDLWKVFDKLQDQATELSSELGIFSKVAHLPAVSYGDNGRNILITEDPEGFPRAFRKRTSCGPIWSNWS
jgi:hypothetical protein